MKATRSGSPRIEISAVEIDSQIPWASLLPLCARWLYGSVGLCVDAHLARRWSAFPTRNLVRL